MDPWTPDEMERVLEAMAGDLTPMEWADIMGVKVDAWRRLPKTKAAQAIKVHCLDAMPITQAAHQEGVCITTMRRMRNARNPEIADITHEARWLLRRSGRSISDFARHVGKKRTTVANWFETGVRFPPYYLRMLREWDTLEDKAR